MAITVTKKKKTVSVARPEEEAPAEAPAARAGALPASMASSAPVGHQTIGIAPPVFATQQVSFGGPVAMAIIAMLLFMGLLGLQWMELEYLKPMFPVMQATALAPGSTPAGGEMSAMPSAVPEIPTMSIMMGGGALAVVVFGLPIVLCILIIAGLWKIFSKAGKPGWASIIPIYQTVLFVQIAGKPTWWFFILWLIVPAIIVLFALAKNFGKGIGFGFGLLFFPFIFLPILGFGSAQHISAAVAETE